MSYRPVSVEDSRDYQDLSSVANPALDKYVRSHTARASSYLSADDATDTERQSFTSSTPFNNRPGDETLSQTTSQTSTSRGWRRLSAAPAWEHRLSEKHLSGTPSTSSTSRYFDRSRQTRRVLIDCLWMWLGTAIVCAGIAAVLRGFQSRQNGLVTSEKYTFNTLINGLLLVLGIAFAAQFKQYCEMLRWRFLASSYRTLEEFEEVLDCDSWRSATRLMFRGGRGRSRFKAQILAIVWVLIFATFNVFSSLLGLTYSLEISEDFATVKQGNVSVLDLKYISVFPDPKLQDIPSQDIPLDNQISGANYWGQVGQVNILYENQVDSTGPSWIIQFYDLGRDGTVTESGRYVESWATCESKLFKSSSVDKCQSDSQSLMIECLCPESGEIEDCLPIFDAVNPLTLWMGHVLSLYEPQLSTCGDRCATIVAYPFDRKRQDEQNSPERRQLWWCQNRLSNVVDDIGRDSTIGVIRDAQARLLAGAIGWSGILMPLNDTMSSPWMYSRVLGDQSSQYNTNTTTADEVAGLIMNFTVGAIRALDLSGSLRSWVNGSEPCKLLALEVEWGRAAPMLIGIPGLQLAMLFAVTLLSRKTIILEPSYITIARLFQPMLQKLGRRGVLMTAKEISEAMGPNFKIAYSVRPNYGPETPHDLDLVEESEGFGYIRGMMPEGRYD